VYIIAERYLGHIFGQNESGSISTLCAYRISISLILTYNPAHSKLNILQKEKLSLISMLDILNQNAWNMMLW